LFNPRRHKWSRHFRWEGAYLVGLTPMGRVLVELLNINDPLRVELREELIEEDLFPRSNAACGPKRMVHAFVSCPAADSGK